MSKSPLITLACLTLALSSCERHRVELEPGVLSISVEQHSAWVRNFNPLGPGQPRWPTRSGVYEPLLVSNGMTGAWVPWLATSHSWSQDLETLTFKIREGVKWSDGRPFSAKDVKFTFELLREHKALDRGALWSFIESVDAPDARTVTIRFKRVYVPGLADVASVPIVPEHVWSKIEDPITFANPDPVATGPFTKVEVFRNQVYELGRNPHYWQPEKPKVKGLRFLAYPSNDQANLALIEGSVDWAGNFVPAIDRTYVARDPDHNTYWFPSFGAMIFLYVNTTKPEFSDARVRKAMSMAIDRERLVEIAMYDYTSPADPSGLPSAFAAWRDEVGESWIRFDRDRANALLDEAGMKRGAGGWRTTPDGAPMEFEIDVVSGWSDWVRAAQVVADNLEEVGVRAKVRPSEFGAWFSRLQNGEFSAAVSWSNEGDTPYNYYRYLMSTKTVVPVGESAPANWHRLGDPQTDELLEQFEQAREDTERKALGKRLQARFLDTAPAIPLFPGPVWAAYSTRRFDGFPTPENPYARPSPNNAPDCLLVLTTLEPKEQTP